jgi:serine/threonine protein kinase
MSAAEGRTLGAYRLLERIGKGGMGEVYRALHLKLGTERAVKVLPPALAAEPDFLRRFEREAAAAAALNHPNILAVHDYGEADGVPYLVMPYIGAGTLKDRLVGGTITPAQFARALTEVAGALDYAHRQGIVHRDVKPANVLIDADERAYLADFGIAKALAGGEALTQTGLGVGTPEYMAPEQAQGRAEPRSDLYALGIMLFQLLTGQVPYSGTSTVEVLMKHLQEPIPLGALRGPAAREFGPILTRALAKDPARRYPTGRELMDHANAALARIGVIEPGDPVAYHGAATTPGPQRGTPPPPRHATTPAPRPTQRTSRDRPGRRGKGRGARPRRRRPARTPSPPPSRSRARARARGPAPTAPPTSDPTPPPPRPGSARTTPPASTRPARRDRPHRRPPRSARHSRPPSSPPLRRRRTPTSPRHSSARRRCRCAARAAARWRTWTPTPAASSSSSRSSPPSSSSSAAAFSASRSSAGDESRVVGRES